MIFETPYQTFPFSKVAPGDYIPLILKEMESAKETYRQIATAKEMPTFQNTLLPLAYAELDLNRLNKAFFNLNLASTTAEIQRIAPEIASIFSDFHNDFYANEAIFQKIQFVYENEKDIIGEDKAFLKKIYKKFIRNGALLSEKGKQRLKEIDKAISQKKIHFENNVLAATNAFELLVSDEKELAGLPEDILYKAKKLAEEKGKEGWLFGLDYPTYISFVCYAENRKLREKMFVSYLSKCFESEKNDNRQLVLDIVSLRNERSKLLGYKSYSDYILEERMAGSVSNVLDFLNELLEKSLPVAKKQFQMLADYAQKRDNITDFNKWDTYFYTEKISKELFDINDEVLRPYFETNKVLAGVFSLSERLFGLHFEEIFDVDTYHKDIKTFKVTDSEGNYIAILYIDLYSRANKKNGAWMTSYKSQYQTPDGENSRPHISIVCNFPSPTSETPSLLTFYNVITLFHEFGHALHGMFSDTKYPTLSGTNVSRDFVELPSQLFQNFCYQKEVLALFATHYETGAPLPLTYIDKIQDSMYLTEGLQILRQLDFCFLDIYWHTNEKECSVDNFLSLEKSFLKRTDIYPDIPNTSISTSFSHIFSGGYASGYYSYKWSEVLEADAFEYFLEKGIFNPEITQSYKEIILKKGGTEPPMDLYVAFRGKKPTIDALLHRSKLIDKK